MKLNDTYKGLIFGLIGVIAAVASFMYVAQPNYQTMQSIKSENVVLKSRLAELQAKQANREQYLADTAKFNEEYDAILNSFPADLNQEVTIMFVEGLRDNYGFDATSLEMGEKEQFYTLGVGGGDAALPTKTISKEVSNICDILVNVGACKSKSEARNIIAGGGVKVNDDTISDFAYSVSDEMKANGFILHKGKKVHIKIVSE